MALTGDMTAISLSKITSLFSPPPQYSGIFSVSLSVTPPSLSLLLSTPLLQCSPNLHFRPSVLRNGGIDVSSEHGGPRNEDTVDDYGDEEEILDYEGYQSEGSDYDFIIDEEELEAEARVALREFSTSLSRELRIEEDEAKIHKDVDGKQKRQKIVPKNIPDHLLPKVAIFGRPNVGKSALFNRLVGGNKAIVVDEPGVTVYMGGLFGETMSSWS